MKGKLLTLVLSFFFSTKEKGRTRNLGANALRAQLINRALAEASRRYKKSR